MENPGIGTQNDLGEVQTIEPSKQPVTCQAKANIQEAAIIMAQHQVGSIIIVNVQNHPIGIVTDKDLRNKVVTGKIPLSAEIGRIMSSPVVTIPPNQTVADIQITMMKNQVHHLVLTENGLPNSPIIGVISEHDLLVVQGNNPAVFMKEINRCQSAEALLAVREKSEVLLRKYLLQEVSIDFICNVISEINDALCRRVIQLCQESIKKETGDKLPVNWCWLALGSAGRQEQLLRTDQDNALIFEDVLENEKEAVKSYFLNLARRITSMLHRCGFDYCPGDMMASNPRWCLSLSEWKNQFSNWIFQPTAQNKLYCNIFFDYRPVYGDTQLAQDLTEHIFSAIEDQTVFLPMLASNSIKHGPRLTFFRKFVLEKSGANKGCFDLKGRAMIPLADAARVLILDKKALGINNTFRRFDHLADTEPKNRSLFTDVADAYELFVRIRALQGLHHKTTGRYLKPSELSRMQRLNLRNSFQVIKQIEELIKIRFQLNLMI